MNLSGLLRRIALVIALAGAVPLAAGGTVHAAEMPNPMAMMGEPVALTGDAVQAFISSYAAIKAAAPEIGKKYGVQAEEGAAPTDAWGAFMTATAAWGELNGLVSQYGYSDFQTWLQTTMSIAMAYTFAKEGNGMDTQMQAAIDQIKNNASLSDDQKKMMIDQMQAATGTISAMRPPQGNIDAVAPYLAQLAPLFQ
jgi:hypothetical protein